MIYDLVKDVISVESLARRVFPTKIEVHEYTIALLMITATNHNDQQGTIHLQNDVGSPALESALKWGTFIPTVSTAQADSGEPHAAEGQQRHVRDTQPQSSETFAVTRSSSTLSLWGAPVHLHAIATLGESVCREMHAPLHVEAIRTCRAGRELTHHEAYGGSLESRWRTLVKHHN